MKRIFLFVVTNLVVVLTISLVIHLIGLDRMLVRGGVGYGPLLAVCMVWGMTGSIISLLLSKFTAKMSLGVVPIDRSSELGWLVTMVDQLAAKAGLPVTPEVGVYDSYEVNAFATGPTKRHALVAFSSGLLRSMSRDEIEGVAAHELAHIKNGDMVTMTLLQGVVNAFVFFFARVIAWALTQNGRDDDRPVASSMWLVMLLEIVLAPLGMMIVAAFSRWREFRADSGGAQYAGKRDMIAALQRLAMNTRMYDDHPSLATLKISGGIGSLLATHPPLEKRIAALREAPEIG